MFCGMTCPAKGFTIFCGILPGQPAFDIALMVNLQNSFIRTSSALATLIVVNLDDIVPKFLPFLQIVVGHLSKVDVVLMAMKPIASYSSKDNDILGLMHCDPSCRSSLLKMSSYAPLCTFVQQCNLGIYILHCCTNCMYAEKQHVTNIEYCPFYNMILHSKLHRKFTL